MNSFLLKDQYFLLNHSNVTLLIVTKCVMTTHEYDYGYIIIISEIVFFT